MLFVVESSCCFDLKLANKLQFGASGQLTVNIENSRTKKKIEFSNILSV